MEKERETRRRHLKVMLLESGGWGGIHYYAHALANALAEQPVEVVLLTHQRYELEDEPRRFRVLRVLRRENYLRTLIRVLRLLRREAPDLLHVQSFISQRKDLLLLLLCRLLGVRLVLTVHNILPHEVRPLEQTLYFACYRLADGLIVHSRRNRERLLGHLPGLDRDKVHHIPHGNYAHFRHLSSSRTHARERLGLPAERKIVLFFGAIRPYKGLDVFLEMIPTVRREHPEAFFVVAGNVLRGTRTEYEQQIARLGLGEDDLTVRFAYLSNEEVITYVCASDLVVLPYRHIYQSGVLLMAFSFGRPVLATRVGSFPETVDEGRTGWLVPPDDPAQMTSALCRILDDPEGLERAGACARQVADEEYGWDGIAARTVEVYRQMVSE